MDNIVGIIGGMGPMATVDLFKKTLLSTHAIIDQDHIHLLIDNNTSIPDRSSYILGEGENPLEEMFISAKRLIAGGAKLLAMPCNTAHYFYNDLNTLISLENPNITFLNMIELTAIKIKELGYTKVYLLATQGTYRTNIYNKFLQDYSIELVLPNEDIRKLIMKSIYDYKSGYLSYKDNLPIIINDIKDSDVSVIILGCTELPLIFEGINDDFHIVDPSKVLAEGIVNHSKTAVNI